MRIWDIAPSKLCRQHLLGEHRELHAIWSILIHDKKGYSKHPETKRWKGKLLALYYRHQKLVKEMKKRRYNHNSDLDYSFAKGGRVQNDYIQSYTEQIKRLKRKKCRCKV
ncbi:pyrimidine dimer DNA glycosylase/endonuclease V [Candidatus Micrarchaeota archaeon]|nr:pyrimidine dimer DNA glycosylase/endonuclease V [Candidatus Micrarchaeota archaeon]